MPPLPVVVISIGLVGQQRSSSRGAGGADRGRQGQRSALASRPPRRRWRRRLDPVWPDSAVHDWHARATAPEAVVRLCLDLHRSLGERLAGPRLVRRRTAFGQQKASCTCKATQRDHF